MKDILFIAPVFFDYYKNIVEEFENQGVKAHYFADLPSQGFLTKVSYRMARGLMSWKSRRYTKRIIKALEGIDIEQVLIIDGQYLHPGDVKLLRKAFPNAKFTYYLWDALGNFPYSKKLFPFFDVTKSFEKRDCDANPNLIYQPTFYRPQYGTPVKHEGVYEYEGAFIGTIRPHKYVFVNRLKEEFEKAGKPFFTYYYLPHKLVYRYFALRSKPFRKLGAKNVNYKKIGDEKVRHVYQNTHFVIDCPPQNQFSPTIRFYEALASGRKVITQCEAAKESPLYRPENIYVFKDQIDFDDPFFHSEFAPYDKETLEEFSLASWCRRILQ